MLTGAEGRSIYNECIGAGLVEGGVDWAIEIDDWTSLFGPLASLQDQQRNRRQADRIAQRIVRYRQGRPGRPVILIGQSGGGGLAPWVVEALPEGTKVDGVILIAPALSPQYPLGRALSRSRRGIVNFHSQMDWVILGLGTSVFGTIDGERVDSAGKVGFTTPENEDIELYDRLYQVPWSMEMAQKGHFGGHLTSSSIWFVREYVAPLVLSETWSSLLPTPATP